MTYGSLAFSKNFRPRTPIWVPLFVPFVCFCKSLSVPLLAAPPALPALTHFALRTSDSSPP